MTKATPPNDFIVCIAVWFVCVCVRIHEPKEEILSVDESKHKVTLVHTLQTQTT
eukprot:m.12266 g.12266  ORF g.12266 m.12266 type:complete len:54 (-) comp5815_c0_seq1:1513-1674(-)